MLGWGCDWHHECLDFGGGVDQHTGCTSPHRPCGDGLAESAHRAVCGHSGYSDQRVDVYSCQWCGDAGFGCGDCVRSCSV